MRSLTLGTIKQYTEINHFTILYIILKYISTIFNDDISTMGASPVTMISFSLRYVILTSTVFHPPFSPFLSDDDDDDVCLNITLSQDTEDYANPLHESELQPACVTYL